jgi:hypothetical protein
MGSFEEEGELQARARTRVGVQSLRVHVPAARAWRLQVGQGAGADPGVRHLRRVQAPGAILTRATGRPRRREFVALRIRSNSSAQSKFSSCAISPLDWLERLPRLCKGIDHSPGVAVLVAAPDNRRAVHRYMITIEGPSFEDVDKVELPAPPQPGEPIETNLGTCIVTQTTLTSRASPMAWPRARRLSVGTRQRRRRTRRIYGGLRRSLLAWSGCASLQEDA